MKFTIYLIHLDHPIHHAQHYIGFTSDLPTRIKTHRSGNGAKLLKHANELGILYRVVRTWRGGQWVNGARRAEKNLKARKNARKICPICNPKITKFEVDTNELQ